MRSVSLCFIALLLPFLLLPVVKCSLDGHFFVGMYNETGPTSVAWYSVTNIGHPVVVANISAGPNISWIAFHPSLPVAYAVQESTLGLIGAYMVDDAAHTFSAVGNAQSSGGNYPVHASVHASGRFIFVANYGGNVAVLPVQPNGSLLPPVQTVNTGFFSHCVVVSPVNHSHVFVVSLANDVVNQFVFDLSSGRLLPNPFATGMSLPPGTGPRHLLIHPLHPIAFISDEGNGTTAALITVCAYDAARGTLSLLRSRSALPHGADAKGMLPSELLLSKDGRFLYVSIRDVAGASDSVAVFSVNHAAADVLLLANAPVCWCPRSMALVESEWSHVLVVGCQLTRAVQAFVVDRDSGMLKSAGRGPIMNNPVAFVGALAYQPPGPP
jgi:6-phosphogluconolactonase